MTMATRTDPLRPSFLIPIEGGSSLLSSSHNGVQGPQVSAFHGSAELDHQMDSYCPKQGSNGAGLVEALGGSQ